MSANVHHTQVIKRFQTQKTHKGLLPNPVKIVYDDNRKCNLENIDSSKMQTLGGTHAPLISKFN